MSSAIKLGQLTGAGLGFAKGGDFGLNLVGEKINLDWSRSVT